jgi:hypothetical protein
MTEHTPQLSLWPPLLALAITLIISGILSIWVVSLIGIALLLFSIYGWTQENRASGEMTDEAFEAETEEQGHE